jgi:cell division protein FtsI (penicillin-binding protein 3)
MVKAFYIQQAEGKYWRGMNDSLHEKIESIEPERGTIYSEDGEMLSTSIPEFDVYVDFSADGVRENNGKRFFANLDSLSYDLSRLFKDRTAAEYKALLTGGFNDGARYFPLLKRVSFENYQLLKQMPFVRLGRNKSGFIAEVQNKRLNPYHMLAFRTVGLDRDNSQKVGLEQTYDSLLKGKTGKRLVRYMPGGIAIPVEDDYQIEPENGKDIVTTIDIHLQDITEQALMNMLISNEAQHGCAIVMEVKTGKIKAIANLGKQSDGSYWEDFNYAMQPTEPGSTFKLVTLMSMLSDNKITLNSMVNLSGGKWTVNGRTVIDAEEHDGSDDDVTAKRAFEVSSNVGMAKLAYNSYAATPSMFTNHVRRLGFDSLTGIDLYGERPPVVYRPGKPNWSSTTLPWMAFGYNVEITPMHTTMLYNAIANGGKMMKPFLMEAVMNDAKIVKQTNPVVLRDKICSDDVLQQVKECLRGVCSDSGSTAFKLFKGRPYKVSGKTGTALVAGGKVTYADKVFQSSFAGYFPADDPQYTCVVVIVNKPDAVRHVGADVAGPVFREIADKLYSMYIKQSVPVKYAGIVAGGDTISYSYGGHKDEVKKIMAELNVPYIDAGSSGTDWAGLTKQNGRPVMQGKTITDKQMPQLGGMGLKDALYICEDLGLKVNVRGKGKVITQSIAAGGAFRRGQAIEITLN